jgi:hypothetical protein
MEQGFRALSSTRSRRMTEDDYRRDLERLRTENEFQHEREPDTGSAFRTVMFVISCTALALFVYFGFVASR